MPASDTTATGTQQSADSPYQHVLVPIDGSGALLDRFDAVAPLLAWTDATIHVLHVIAPERARQGDPRADAERLVTETTEHLADRGFAVESHVVEGMPEDQIVGATETLDIDLIVMVTRGGGLLTPSITRMVLQAVDVPVIALGA